MPREGRLRDDDKVSGFGDSKPRCARRRKRDRHSGAAGAIVAVLGGGRFPARNYGGRWGCRIVVGVRRAEVRMETRPDAHRVRLQSDWRHRERREHEDQKDGPGAAVKGATAREHGAAILTRSVSSCRIRAGSDALQYRLGFLA